MAEIRLDAADRLQFGQLGELAQGKVPFAGGEQAVHAAGERGHCGRVPGLVGFLNEQGPDRGNHLYVGARRLGRRGAAMEIGRDGHVGADAAALFTCRSSCTVASCAQKGTDPSVMAV